MNQNNRWASFVCLLAVMALFSLPGAQRPAEAATTKAFGYAYTPVFTGGCLTYDPWCRVVITDQQAGTSYTTYTNFFGYWSCYLPGNRTYMFWAESTQFPYFQSDYVWKYIPSHPWWPGIYATDLFCMYWDV